MNLPRNASPLVWKIETSVSGILTGSCNLDPPSIDHLTEWKPRDNESERGFRSCSRLPRDWRHFFEQLFSYPTHFSPDHSLYECGVQGIIPGGYLAPHLDWAVHPDGRERRLNLVLFLNYASGALDFYDDACGAVVYSVDPIPGRFVVWEPSDTCYHGVSTNVCSVERFTANVSFLAEKRPGATRKRSLFIPRR